ncbi:MAG: ribbon-helix-helix domain-containing protein [Candidatus Hodarchaeota archaeon]
MPKKKEGKAPMKNITINIPDLYDENILKLIDLKITPSRSEFVRTALREFLQKQREELELLGFFEEKNDLKLNLIPGVKQIESCRS